jgi:hypothetical protein
LSGGTPVLSGSEPIKSGSVPALSGGEGDKEVNPVLPRISQIVTLIRVIRGKDNRVRHRQVPLYRSRFWKTRIARIKVPTRYKTA